MTPTKVTDLTIDDLRAMIADEVKRQREAEQEENVVNQSSQKLRSPLDVPILDVGPWPEGLKLISREEYYDDDGR